MGELLDYFKGRFKADVSESEDMMHKVKVRSIIADLCEKYLLDADSVFTFEVLPNDLPYAVIVIDEEPLKSKYCINQVSKFLFEASLKEVEF